MAHPVDILRVESMGGAEWGAGGTWTAIKSLSPLQNDLELQVELVEEESSCARVCGAGLAGAVRGKFCNQLRGSNSSWFDPTNKHEYLICDYLRQEKFRIKAHILIFEKGRWSCNV